MQRGTVIDNRGLLKQILEATRDVWDRPGTRESVRTSFNAVIDCGTQRLGWRVYASDSEERRCFFRCKSRSCPSCGFRSTIQWLAEQDADLLDIPYTGRIFTTPSELRNIFRRNRHLLHDLPTLAAAVLQQWIRMKYGVNSLILMVPHTFGGDLKFHCHIHVLISVGGFKESTGRWISDLHLNKYAIGRMWSYAVIKHLQSALENGVLKSDLCRRDSLRLLSTVYEKHPRWIVLGRGVVDKANFVKYAARYLRRPPIATWRILKVVDGHVVFIAKDTMNSSLVPTRCRLDHFVRLLAAHVTDRYEHGVRYFGLLAPNVKNRVLAGLFLLLGQRRRTRPPRLSWRDSIKKCFGIDPMLDNLGREMHWI